MKSRAVVVVFAAYTDPGGLVADAIDLARRHRCDLELIAVVSPLWWLLMESSWAHTSFDPREGEDELAIDLGRLVATVPRDVPVCSRVLRRRRRQVLREVAARNPIAVLTDRRSRGSLESPFHGAQPSPDAPPSSARLEGGTARRRHGFFTS